MNLSIFILLRGCACVIKTCLLRESRMLCFAYRDRGSWEELRGEGWGGGGLAGNEPSAL